MHAQCTLSARSAHATVHVQCTLVFTETKPLIDVLQNKGCNVYVCSSITVCFVLYFLCLLSEPRQKKRNRKIGGDRDEFAREAHAMRLLAKRDRLLGLACFFQ